MTHEAACKTWINNKDIYTDKTIRSRITGLDFYVESVEIRKKHKGIDGYDVDCITINTNLSKSPIYILVTEALAVFDIIL